MRNDNSILNTTKLITGKDGRVFVTTPNTNKVFLAEVDTFSVPMNITNVPCQPVGSLLEFGVTASYSVSLSLTEMVIRDDTMFDILIEDFSLVIHHLLTLMVYFIGEMDKSKEWFLEDVYLMDK